ncbi:putative ammonium transporter 3 [Dermacentor silvarum]|uniref:putative ammonium transporter 3 n=1 Tax=Dermacentor silvarum TaxID=543639 RepID=UPI00189C5451|nr:putative ammonium transporter 3 [Dermacentor silvarum]
MIVDPKSMKPDDATWVLTSSFVIFTMQTGFGLLESGCVSKKNEVNILMKNAVDVVLGGLTYWSVGYGLQNGRGPGTNPFCGVGSFFLDAGSEVMGEEFAMFIFQLSFATTATTIVSGAMAERTNFHAYCLFSALSTLMYCIPAGWVWSRHGFLNGIGVIDFAGSACVHLLGGTSGLISALMLGPRLSWDRHSRPRMGNPTNAMIGTFTLWWGSLVFNSGSTFGISDEKWHFAARSAVSTINSSIGGGLVGTIATYLVHKNFDIEDIITSILGSLVSVTAGSAFYRSWEALLVGAVGGLCTTPVPSLLRRWLSVDDPVNAAAIHGVGGLWGMLAVGLFLDTTRYQGLRHHRLGLFKGGGGSLLGIQLAACLTIIAWSASVTFLVLKFINKVTPLRMRPCDELLGADFVEHCIDHREPDQSFPATHLCRDTSAETEPPDASLLRAEDEGEAYQKEDIPVEGKDMERASNAEDESPVGCASPDFQRDAATPFWEAMSAECHDGLANKDSLNQQEMTIRLVANYRSNCTIA